MVVMSGTFRRPRSAPFVRAVPRGKAVSVPRSKPVTASFRRSRSGVAPKQRGLTNARLRFRRVLKRRERITLREFGASKRPYIGSRKSSLSKKIIMPYMYNKAPKQSDLQVPRFHFTGGQMGGGKVIRQYRCTITVPNNAASFTSAAYSWRVGFSGGVHTMELYQGQAISGTGTLVSAAPNYPTEAGYFMDTFKYFRINRIQMEIIPTLTGAEETASSVLDQATQSDAGVIYYGTYNGTLEQFTSGGVFASTSALDYCRQNRYRTLRVIGGTAKCLAQRCTTLLEEDMPATTNEVKTPMFPVLRTKDIISSSPSQYQGYGLSFMWDHGNLAANAAKCFVQMRFSVEVQWNTLLDAEINSFRKLVDEGKANQHTIPKVIVEDDKPDIDLKDNEYEMPELKPTGAPPPSPSLQQQSGPPNSKPLVKDRPLPLSRPPTPTRSK